MEVRKRPAKGARIAHALVVMFAPLTFVKDRIPTPLGRMLVVTDERDELRALEWEDHEPRMHRLLALHYGARAVTLVEGEAPSSVRGKVEAYFDGELGAIAPLVVTTGGTEFQRSVWSALREIPAGETLTYGALAARIARPKAVRAVGLANGANPVGVVVPCHRVIGANASLTGYAGGIARKRWLLAHEGVS
jgi:methylated-DNA-[protein]-cysteine S-methyltransferase